MLDPAPASENLPRAMLGVDVLTPNQSEAETLLGHEPSTKVRRKGVIDPKQIAMELLSKGPRSVVLKLGNKGAMLLERSGQIETIKSFATKVVDTTAAGDAFAAALAVARAEGADARSAVVFGNAAGALCCQNFGAQPSLPARAAVDKLIAGKA